MENPLQNYITMFKNWCRSAGDKRLSLLGRQSLSFLGGYLTKKHSKKRKKKRKRESRRKELEKWFCLIYLMASKKARLTSVFNI